MKRSVALSAIVAPLLIGTAVLAPSASAQAPLANGFTAKVVASTGQIITGTVDAAGYDVGIYIGPGVHGVIVAGATVRGANDEGILVQDASGVIIKNSTIEGNGVAPADDLGELKAIVLAGTRGAVVTNNTVANNNRGGIGVYDDGPSVVSAPAAVAQHPIAGVGNVVSSNQVLDNGTDCGIVVSAKNPGGGVLSTVISDNTVTGFDPQAGDNSQSLGGVIVAGGAMGAVSVTNTMVVHNTVRGGFIPGISLHASAPGSITGTQLINNVLSDNGGGAAGGTTGIEVLSDPGVAVNTQIVGDQVSNDQFGVFHVGDTRTNIVHLTTTNVAVPVAP
jgi:hypothetical protein